MDYDVICARGPVGGCGFRVHDRYFETKPRFRPGICPRCNGPVQVVSKNTDTPVVGAKIDDSGRVVVVA